MRVMRHVSSLSFEFRGAFLAEGLLTFNIVVAEIAGLNRSVTGGDIPIFRILDQFVHGDFRCGNRERCILCNAPGVGFDEFVEFVRRYDVVDPTDRFRFLGRVIAPRREDFLCVAGPEVLDQAADIRDGVAKSDTGGRDGETGAVGGYLNVAV